MSLWMVRGGRTGEFEEAMLDQGISAIGWSNLPDLSQATTRDAIAGLMRAAYPDASDARINNFVGQVFAFAHRIQKGDLILMPRKNRPQIAVARVAGGYKYRPELGRMPHTRSVEWIRTDLPRTRLEQDLLYSLGAIMAVCRVHRNDAEERIRAILAGKPDTGASASAETSPEGEEVPNEAQALTDVESIARDQILKHLERNFRGHDLARLVEAVLQAEGYLTHRSPAGADGGVDVLAGRGPLGLDPPRLCVQVKSSDSPADVTVLRALQGTMSTFKADQGLLVSWGGVNRVVEKEARMSFFSVRLWDADDLIDAILLNYERLPEELQNELPLKRVWALVVEE